MPYLNNDVNGVNPSNGNNNAQNNSSSNAQFEQMLNDQTARRQSGMNQQKAN